MLFDLAIIGGGPAGCAAATVAARNGARVLLLERGQFPRHKVCGEFVSAESLSLLEDLFAGEFKTVIASSPRISRTRIFVDGRMLEAEICPAAASITRFQLDSALWHSCCVAGVECHPETYVQAAHGLGPFRIITRGEVFEARAIVNATGRWSNLTSPAARALTNGEKWLGVKAHFSEPLVSNAVDLYFFEGGYCGVQPIAFRENAARAQINACAMVRAEVATSLAGVLTQNGRLSERSRSWQPETEPVTTSPLIFHEPEPLQGNILQVGDAAAFVDPFIGDGISLALRSGALAAECLAPFFRGQRSLDQVSTEYSREYEIRFANVFRTSSKIRGLLGWPRIVRKPVLSLLAQTPFITKQIIRMTR